MSLRTFPWVSPKPSVPAGGCDSNKDVSWQPSPTADRKLVPSCSPDYSLDPALYPFGGAYKSTGLQDYPTIMDRLDAAGLSWRLYAAGGPGGPQPSWSPLWMKSLCWLPVRSGRSTGITWSLP